MELALSLGETPKPFSLLDKVSKMPNKDPSFCMALGSGFNGKVSQEKIGNHTEDEDERRGSSDPPLQLELLPFTPVPRSQPKSQLRIPWLSEACKFQEFKIFLLILDYRLV